MAALMGHVVHHEPWGVVDLDTAAGHVFVRQDRRYEWRNPSDLPPWTAKEKTGFHRTIDSLVDTRHVYRSNAHFFWGHLDGFVAPLRFAVDTVEQRRLVFDATTGAVAEVTRPGPSSLVREPPGVRWDKAIDIPPRKVGGEGGSSP